MFNRNRPQSRKLLVLLYPKVSIAETMPLNWGVPSFAPSPNEDADISSVSAAALLSLLFQISSGSLKRYDVNQQLARSTGQAFRSRWV